MVSGGPLGGLSLDEEFAGRTRLFERKEEDTRIACVHLKTRLTAVLLLKRGG